MSDEWGICDLLDMPHKKDGSTAGYVQPCVNWRPLGAIGKLLATKDAEIARLTQERDAAVAAADEAIEKSAMIAHKVMFAEKDGLRMRVCCAIRSLKGIHTLTHERELERVRAAIAEGKECLEILRARVGPMSMARNLISTRVAELQRREKELLSNLQDIENGKKL
jgi:hypothetical protein